MTSIIGNNRDGLNESPIIGKINTLHKQDEHEAQSKPEGGLQASLCSNNGLSCGSPSGFIDIDPIKRHEAIDYLANILIDAFISHKRKMKYEQSKSKSNT